MRIVVTGARGLLGGEIMRAFGVAAMGWSGGEHEGFRRVDVTLQDEIERGLDADRPDLVVNCAANPNVASCEADPDAARELNALAVRRLTAATRARDMVLVQISTDYVFSGDQADGYTETAPPKPLSVYGRTKAEGEQYCLQAATGLVVRLPLLFGTARTIPRTTFPLEVVSTLRAGRGLVADAVAIRQPTLTADVADTVRQLVDRRAAGIVHVAAQQGITKYDWALAVAGAAGLDPGAISPARPTPDGLRPVRSYLLGERLATLHVGPPRPVSQTTGPFLREAGLL